MKATLFLLTFHLLAVFAASATATTTPEGFTAAFRAALEQKDAAALEFMIYQVGMSDSDKAQARRVQEMVLANPAEIDQIALAPLPADFQHTIIMRGFKFEPTHPPVGMIDVKFKPGPNGVTASSSAYTIVDGKFYLVGSKRTDLGWKGPPDKNIGFMVLGNRQDDVQIRVKWNASGIDQERNFDEPSSTFIGQYIESVVVTSEHEDTDVTITVQDEGTSIFTSVPLRGRGTVEYRKEQ